MFSCLFCRSNESADQQERPVLSDEQEASTQSSNPGNTPEGRKRSLGDDVDDNNKNGENLQAPKSKEIKTI